MRRHEVEGLNKPLDLVDEIIWKLKDNTNEFHLKSIFSMIGM